MICRCVHLIVDLCVARVSHHPWKAFSGARFEVKHEKPDVPHHCSTPFLKTRISVSAVAGLVLSYLILSCLVHRWEAAREAEEGLERSNGRAEEAYGKVGRCCCRFLLMLLLLLCWFLWMG